MALERKPYGTTTGGEAVEQFTLRNKNGLEVRCINYGCRITHLLVPGADGPTDVVLGYDTLAEYEQDGSFQGALVGRYANRIRGAEMMVDGVDYPLTLVEKELGNYLHGSYHKKVFTPDVLGESSVSFTYTSPDGEDGFPGETWTAVTYTLTENNELMVDYLAVPQADTYINLTNHSYFNLAGAGSGTVEQHLLQLESASFVEIDKTFCPTGRIVDATGGAFDFTAEKPIGRDIGRDDPQLVLAGGYDHCFVLEKQRGGKMTLAAMAKDPASGRGMLVYTTQPGVQLYTGNMLPEQTPGKGGVPFGRRGGFCLETEHFPDTPHQPEFPPALVMKGEKYRQATLFKFVW